MTAQETRDRLAVARGAADRHAWQEAYDALAALDREGGADAAALELLGSMAWWASRADESLAANERAYVAYLGEGNRARAAYMALLVARDHQTQLSEAVAGGWYARAARILAEETECFAHGYLALADAQRALYAGDFAVAAALGERAVAIGARFQEHDLQGYGLTFQGMALVRRGDFQQGLLLLDEAAAAAVAGELSPYATGVVYCQTISTCRDLADYRRAGQWTEVAERWCERQAISGFPGVCRVHRAEILALRGAWADAESEALRASEELLSFKALPQAAEGYYTLGEVRLRMGEIEGAEDAFRQAHALGRDPQPGRALLLLAQGRADAALPSIERALSGPPGERLGRARMLPAYIEIAIAAGALDGARTATDELAAIAADFGSLVLRAAARSAAGAVLLASGDADAALRELHEARTLWQSADAPFELARTRALLADALRALGDTDDAVMELDAARAAFALLGAAREEARCARVLDELRGRVQQGERQRRTFVFTDIVGSTELIGVIGDEAWSDVIRWHDQTLRKIAAEHGGEEVNQAGDGFFFAFPDVRSAVECATAIQRALADHRREAGFAPRVRIGLHAAEATKVDGSYVGQGVHEAARIGAVAGAGEIVASSETLRGEAIERAGTPRSVELKGISGAVDVQTIEWATPAV